MGNAAFLYLVIFYFLLVWISLGRLLELKRAERNRRKLLENGGREFYPGHYRWMVLLHVSWIFSCAVESYWRKSLPPLWLSFLAGFLFLLGFAFRLAAIYTLKGRWTTRIIIPANEPLIQKGIYRHLRHPNYLGVILEILALPLLGGCWITALLFSLMNAPLIAHRIKLEERAWGEAYAKWDFFTGPPRLIPRIGFKHDS